ncbi:uncharacterized protein [Clytia hemisphaerica]|uniref:uncharacterized protein n=1 Tax=Clytia hemisphaerica TaxID=252671 RepID=UPI0034D43FCA
MVHYLDGDSQVHTNLEGRDDLDENLVCYPALVDPIKKKVMGAIWKDEKFYVDPSEKIYVTKQQRVNANKLKKLTKQQIEDKIRTRLKSIDDESLIKKFDQIVKTKAIKDEYIALHEEVFQEEEEI